MSSWIEMIDQNLMRKPVTIRFMSLIPPQAGPAVALVCDVVRGVAGALVAMLGFAPRVHCASLFRSSAKLRYPRYHSVAALLKF